MKVKDVMIADVKTCQPHDNLNRAAQLMWDNRCGTVVVTNKDNTVAGLITDRDVCMGAYTQSRTLHEIPVASAMTREVATCKAEDSVSKAEQAMQERGVRRLPVVDDAGKVRGVVSLTDIARHLDREVREQKASPQVDAAKLGRTLGAISSQPFRAASH